MLTRDMRAFIALEIPERIRGHLFSCTSKCLVDFREFRPINADNLHITLQFLGNLNVALTPEIMGTLEDSLKDFSKFTVCVGDPGVFPPKGYPRILHVGTEKDQNNVSLLASRIRKSMALLGFTEDKPFSPHITLARLRRSSGKRPALAPYWRKAMGSSLQDLRFQNDLLWEVGSVVLMESRLRPEGSVYIVKGKVDLKA